MRSIVLIAKAQEIKTSKSYEKEVLFNFTGFCAEHKLKGVVVTMAIETEISKGEEYIVCLETDMNPRSGILYGKLVRLKPLADSMGFF